MSKEFKIPQYTPLQLNSNIVYGLTKENNISKDELDSVQWLCEAYEHQIKQISDLEAKLAEYENFIKDNGFENLEELDNYIQKIHSHYDEVKNKGTCGLCEKLDNELINQLKQQLAEKEDFIEDLMTGRVKPVIPRIKEIEKQYQDKISFAVDILEELADCSNYIDSKLDFESGSYVSEKVIRDKIKYLKGNKYE